MGVKVKFTYEDYAALPETGPRYQLVEGELVMSLAPNVRHQRIQMRLSQALYSFVALHGLGEILSAPTDVILSEDDVYQPDILFISRARSEIVHPEGLRGAPDLCIEILSAGNRQLDLTVKKKLYALHGVREYWIVDPDADTLAVYRLQEDPLKPLRALGAGETLTSDLLPGFALELGPVFAR
ncbi:MAG: Uma2 family endonuclease [Planctomycetota bacterium]|nr:Uma2 family endonuclease [Planctomycetota bacterium]